MVERLPCKQDVAGSSPVTGSTFRGQLMVGYLALNEAMGVQFLPSEPCAGVAQVAERLALNQDIAGSTPVTGTSAGSSSGRMLGFGPGHAGSSPAPATSTVGMMGYVAQGQERESYKLQVVGSSPTVPTMGVKRGIKATGSGREGA